MLESQSKITKMKIYKTIVEIERAYENNVSHREEK